MFAYPVSMPPPLLPHPVMGRSPIRILASESGPISRRREVFHLRTLYSVLSTLQSTLEFIDCIAIRNNVLTSLYACTGLVRTPSRILVLILKIKWATHPTAPLYTDDNHFRPPENICGLHANNQPSAINHHSGFSNSPRANRSLGRIIAGWGD